MDWQLGKLGKMALVMVSLGGGEIFAVAEVGDFRQINMLGAGCERGISDDERHDQRLLCAVSLRICSTVDQLTFYFKAFERSMTDRNSPF